jgi:6-hydroxymethylpterin diphosphokinase MptE-like protein
MSRLEENLERLVPDARLREALRWCRPGEAAVELADGTPVLRAGGVAMHGRDPVAEAETFAARAELAGVDHVLLFGIGGGHAVEALRRRTEADILVFEPDPELLRLCLAARPLHVGRARVLRDAVAVREALRAVTRRGQRVLLLGWPPAVRRYGEAFRNVAEYVREATVASVVARNTWDLRMSGWIENVLENLPTALGHPRIGAVRGALRGAPAFLLAAGPSLETNIGCLGRLAGRGVILTVNTAVPALDRHGVHPDLVACVESIDVSSHLRGSPGFRGARFAVALPSNPAHLVLDPRGLLPFSDRVGYYSGWLEEIGAATALDSGCCAAHAAFSTALLLGCDPIVLVGQDAALTGGRFYAPSTRFGAMRLATVKDGRASVEGDEAKVRLGGPVPYRAGHPVAVREVAAWGGEGTVLSTEPLDYVRNWYEEVVRDLPATRVLNATEGGARIPGIPEVRLADVLAGLPPTRVDFEAAIAHATPPTTDQIARVHAGLLQAREQVLAAKRAAEKTMAAGADRREQAIARLKEETRVLLLQGYARREVLSVVERQGDLGALCAVLARRASALADHLARAAASLADPARRAA